MWKPRSGSASRLDGQRRSSRRHRYWQYEPGKIHGQCTGRSGISIAVENDELIESIAQVLARDGLPAEDTVRQVLADPGAHRRLLEQQDLVDQLTHIAAEQSGLTCSEIEDELAAFIDAELNNRLPAVHAPVRIHLSWCPECSALYQVSRQIVDAQATGALPAWPRPAPRVSEPRPSRWKLSWVVPQLELARGPKRWLAAPVYRGNTEPDDREFLYDDAPAPDASMVQVILMRPTDLQADAWQIEVAIEEPELYTGATVTLRVGMIERQARSDDAGMASFTNLPADWFLGTTLHDLHITIASREL